MGCRRILSTALVCAVAGTCVSCGPRMREQVSVKPYDRQMPAMPAGAVPTTGRLQTLTAAQAKLKVNPLRGSREALANGRIYYGYYCIMCHGAKGDGNGPVGQSYVPKPTDLSSSKISRLTDGQLYGSMLHGIGHDPVMSQTVPLNQRWRIVTYVRSFARGGSK